MTAQANERRIVFLSGFMGSGKSTVGAALAKSMGMPFIDLDRVTEKLLGETIAASIQTRGETAFREVESRALKNVIGAPAGVVALGGGTLLAPSNRALARSRGVIVTLNVSEAIAVRRVAGGVARPLFREGLLAERRAVYADADLCVDTDAQSADEVVATIAAWLRGRRQ
ncbi:MAG: dephospho-CoA kinase [Deltaproteobacteria bacterium]|nr:dephospho-CoA kinase [Deltaproteobacteria bacterium]